MTGRRRLPAAEASRATARVQAGETFLRSIFALAQERELIRQAAEHLSKAVPDGEPNPVPGLMDRIEALRCVNDRHQALRDLASTVVAFTVEDAAIQMALALSIVTDLRCCAAIKVRTRGDQGEKGSCRVRWRKGGARPEAHATGHLA